MNNRKKLALGIILALSIPTLTQAEGLYFTAQAGTSQQASDSEPYGNNIAVDADFPSEFDTDNATVGAIGIGYKYNERLRVEGRIGYRHSSFDDTNFGTGARAGEEYSLVGDMKSTTFTVEGFYDFPNKSKFTPYVKAGVGVAKNKYSAKLGGAGVAAFDAFDGAADGFYDNYADDDSSSFTWNVGLGGSYKLSKKTSLYGEYQYASFGDVETGQDSFTDGFKTDDASAHEFMAGIRVNF